MIMEQGIILAQADLTAVPADTLKWTLIVIIGLVLVGLQVWTAVRSSKTQITPDPLRVEKLDKFATRDFCEQRHAEVSRRLDGHDKDVRTIYDEIKRNRADNESQANTRSVAVHAKIDDVRRELSEKIDDMPAQIIATLRNTGAIK